MIMKTRKQHQAGFTFIEVLIAGGVMTLGAAMLASFTFHVQQFSVEEQVQNEIERETALFLDYFCRDAMSSVGIVLDYPGTLSNSDTIVFKIPEFDSLGLHIAETYNYVVYDYVAGAGKVKRSVYDDAEGYLLLNETEIPFSSAYWASYGDGRLIEEMVNADSVRSLQSSIMRYESLGNRSYSRSFVAASTLRNIQ